MNQLINFFWTTLSFAPVITYWLRIGPNEAFWYFIGLSFAGLLIPISWLQLGRDPKFYERMGARLVRKFVQNGDYAKHGPRVISNKTNAQSYVNTLVMYEKYHFLCLLFFFFTDIHAILVGQCLLAVLIFLANMIYNVYPMLLQQYNRARLMKMRR